ncbi:MAG TPA: hypothetical protein VFC58_09660 [Desulfosporosinus sp.]|nr:hypothetical protein [Desulfosporosinus sp.]
MNDRGFSQLIFLLVIIVAVVTIAKLVPTIRAKISLRITWKRSLIFAGLYLGVLILLVPMFYRLPNKGLIVLASTQEIKQAQTLSQNTINDLTNLLPLVGDMDQQKGLYQNSSHTFKVESEKLALIGSAIPDNQIFVERKGVDDGKVEVYTYIATHSANNIDFTKLVLPSVISYKNGTLTFNPADQQKLEFNRFSSDFTVTQFETLNKGAGWKGMSSSFGWQVLYIRVPKSLELDKGKFSDRIRMLRSS